MPLYPNGRRFGLSLWNSIPGTLIVELPLFLAGVWLYARRTRARDRTGRIAFWAYVAVLLLLYVEDRFGGPPESTRVIAAAGLVATLALLARPWWFDRHREPDPPLGPISDP
jgi:hypothetical protein